MEIATLTHPYYRSEEDEFLANRDIRRGKFFG